MKILKSICLLFLLAVSYGSCFGASGSNKSQSGQPQVVFNKKTQKPSGRPSAPSNARIYFCYDAENGECVFTLNDDIEYMSVSLESLSTGQMYYGDVDASDPTMSVELPASNYYIMCVTDNGSVYEGEVVVP